jgi:hypothetical protein
MPVPSSDGYNLTSATTNNLKDFFAALYAHFNTTSTRWTPTDETATPAAPPGPAGSFSFTIQSVADPDIELNFCLEGTQAAPDQWDGRVGINPDAQNNPISDSRDPSASAPWYSGQNGQVNENGPLAFYWSVSNVFQVRPGSTQFILIEYDDAITILFKDAARVRFVRGVHAGRIFVPAFQGWSNGSVELDGLGVLGDQPGFSSGSQSYRWLWFDSTRNNSQPGAALNSTIFRQKIGQTVLPCSNQGGQNASWLNHFWSGNTTGVTTAGATIAGLISPVMMTCRMGLATPFGVMKYLRLLPNDAPYRIWVLQGTSIETYMTLGNGWTTTAAPLACIIPDDFVPNP